LCNFICTILIAPSSSSPCCPKELHVNCVGSRVPHVPFFCCHRVFGVTAHSVLPDARRGPGGLGSSEPAQSWWLSPRRVATLETCQLVCHSATRLAWKQCGEVTLHGLTDKVYMEISWHCTTAKKQKKDTGVSSRYSYKLFFYLLFYTRKRLCFNLTMLFNVSHLPFLSFFMAFSHASNNPFQVVYFCFPIKFTIYPDF